MVAYDNDGWNTPPPARLYADDSNGAELNIYKLCPRLPRIGVVRREYLERGQLGEPTAASGKHVPPDSAIWGQYRQIYSPLWQDPQTLYLSAGTVFCTVVVKDPKAAPPAPLGDWDMPYVLKVRVPTLEEPDVRYRAPGLRSFDPPPTLGPPIASYATLVPFTGFAGTRVIRNNQWMRENSPFVRAERLSNFRCIEHVWNPTSETQHGMEIETKSGLEESQQTKVSADCNLTVSYEWGAEAGASCGALSGSAYSKTSVSLSIGFGYERSTGVTQFHEQTRRFALNIPPMTAVGFYQRHDRIRITTSDPSGLGMILGEIGYGCGDNYAYSQYPFPGDEATRDSVMADVPSGVQLLTPWGEMIH
jgi:hypothetical protein